MLTQILGEGADTPTAGELAYRRIRADIVLGRLAPGSRLPLERMRSAYGTSVGTLRELFNRLASDGLVIAEGSRGFQVPDVSSANLRQVADMRQLLESHALKQSFERGDIEWEGRVVAAHHKLATVEKRMADADAADSDESWRRFDWAFHVSLISACGSDVLLDAYASICDKYLRYLIIAAAFRSQAAHEHRALLECALARDWRRAQATLATHIQDCVAQMASVLDARPTASSHTAR